MGEEGQEEVMGQTQEEEQCASLPVQKAAVGQQDEVRERVCQAVVLSGLWEGGESEFKMVWKGCFVDLVEETKAL